MENNPLYRLYIQLKDRVDELSSLSNNGNVGNSTDLSDIIVRIRNLENRPSVDGVLHELSKSIELLKQENNEFKTKMESLHKFENIEARIYNLEVEPKVNIVPLNERISSLESQNLHDRLTALEAKVYELERYTNQIPDLSFRIGEMEKRPELSQRMNALESAVSNLNLNETPT